MGNRITYFVSSHFTAGPTGAQQPLTVHIQQTDQGARLMIPAGQLSQLPGNISKTFKKYSLFVVLPI